ncbi:MICOS complex subunit MIC27 isoform X3 [Plectropomus leopardus]|uniref:MICOS complex subunit MIC27 isoform X3 n=1 Tax=Plectropomus leopardus TaxID=160734 RepID=UPI001C4B9915|nr:MICOS complex subunit MIC27 isoform X3 [Plectropomus leopardus]
MAAKVVMVAVPTVIGIASIRVYTVSEVPTDGLVTREKLNIYNPLPQSAQAQFVPETPGVIQHGLTTARESILPFVQAVKGACVSVKTTSVNLYHAGEDVYYYLKDPPPGFLPRFGTITMAGLIGMFLTRKGSQFKRLAVPLGLMSAGASVCYPAQTVAVFKVTGKKVYAVGQWSSAAVSSLLASKPQEPVAKEVAASQPETVPNPESAVGQESSFTKHGSPQGSAVPETEVKSAESVSLPDPVPQSVPAETEVTTTSEEISAPVATEEPSDIKQAPAKPTPSSEPETIESTPVESAPEEAAPVESAPEEAAPVEAAPVEAVSAEAAPAESAPAEAAPAESAPAEAAPAESAPAEAAPEEAAPAEAAPEEAAPEEAAPEEAAPVEAAPAEAAPEESAPEESAPVEAAPAEAAPEEAAPAEAAPEEAAPVEAVHSPAEPAPPEASDKPAEPAVESAEPEPAAQPELAHPLQVTAVEETPTPTLTPPPPQQPAAENNKGGTSFKPDPALMDFGQSSPEDEDLYSTRS